MILKSLLWSEPSLGACMVQVPHPFPWEREKSCCSLHRGPFSYSGHPWVCPCHGQSLLGNKGVKGSTRAPVAELPQCGNCVIQT